MYEIVDGFAVYSTVDERGSRGSIVGFTLDEQAAKTLATGKGWYGGSGWIERCKFLCIDGAYFPLLSDGPVTIHTQGQSLRAQALTKLTPEERAELGV